MTGAASQAEPGPGDGDITLATGLAGHAIAMAPGEDRGKALNALQVALASRRLEPGLFSGVAGVLYAMNELDPRTSSRARPVLAHLKEFVRRGVAGHDIVSGLAGIGLCAVSLGCGELVGDIRAALRSSAQKLATGGVAWVTSPSRMNRRRRELCPEGTFDFGMAHGSAGVVAFLAHAARTHGDGAATELLADAAAGLAGRAGLREDCTIEGMIGLNGVAFAPQRASWCYGEDGIGTALLAASAVLEDKQLTAIGRDCVIAAGQREQPVEGGLCHGMWGVALVSHAARTHMAAAGCKLPVTADRGTSVPRVVDFSKAGLLNGPVGASYAREILSGSRSLQSALWLGL